MDDVKFITLTNSGYVSFTQNCYKSLEKLEFKKQLDSYCIGRLGCDLLRSQGYSCELIDNESNSNIQQFRSGNWGNIVINKFKIINENLRKYKYVCITDGDIVFEDNRFLEYCLEHIGDQDLLIQNDAQEDSNHTNLCSGFMFIRSNDLTIKLFDAERASISRGLYEKWGDQIYVNEIKGRLAYEMLPLNLFPNGLYYRTHHTKLKPYMIHFNYLFHYEKQSNMERAGKWYL